MKIVGLVGSPRKNGNVDTLIQKALEGAKSNDAQTTILYLNDLKIRGCQACCACKKTGKCAMNDDMTTVYRAIDEADAVIIGSPIYFGRFSAQLAPVMDRLYAYLKPNFTSALGKGKKVGLIFAQNQSDPSLYSGCIDAVGKSLKGIGFETELQPIIGAGLGDLDAASKNDKFLNEAFALGKELANY
jgi:multimeric flavodoxin WrbA